MNALVKNSARLLSANVIAQAIGLIVYPILTRLYSPEDFGLLNLVMSIGSILVILSTADYQNAIVIANTDKQSKALAQLSGCILLVFVAVIGLFATLSGHIARWFNVAQLERVYWFIPIYVLLSGLWNILNMYLTKHEQFAPISRYKIGQNIFTIGSKLSFGYAGVLHFGLLFATLLGPLVALGYILVYIWKHVSTDWKWDKNAICEVAVSYRQFPMFSLPRSLVNIFGASLPAIMLSPWFSLADLGFFSMALTLAFLPISLIVGSIQQVLYQQVAERVNQRQSIRSLLGRINYTTLLIVIPLFAGLYFILPWLTSWLLGETYCVSGEYIRWMLPWLVFTCLNGTICYVADVFMQQRKGLLYESLILLLRLVGLGGGILLGTFEYAVAGYCCMSAVAMLIQLIWFYSLIRHYECSISERVQKE